MVLKVIVNIRMFNFKKKSENAKLRKDKTLDLQQCNEAIPRLLNTH